MESSLDDVAFEGVTLLNDSRRIVLGISALGMLFLTRTSDNSVQPLDQAEGSPAPEGEMGAFFCPA